MRINSVTSNIDFLIGINLVYAVFKFTDDSSACCNETRRTNFEVLIHKMKENDANAQNVKLHCPLKIVRVHSVFFGKLKKKLVIT